MNLKEKQVILDKFRDWFTDELIESHIKNTKKLSNIDEFNINPFLLYYLSNFLEGNCDARSLSKALLYPRVLGTSISTTFGTKMQTFITKVLNAYGSTTQGIDIEFIDQIDLRRKYCQLKSGPNAINKGDVKSIIDDFKAVRNLARTNNQLGIQIQDMVFGLTYGEPNEKNSFIKKVEEEYTVLIGKEFWHRFTGDENFYSNLIEAAEASQQVNSRHIINDVLDSLSNQIESRFNDLGKK